MRGALGGKGACGGRVVRVRQSARGGRGVRVRQGACGGWDMRLAYWRHHPLSLGLRLLVLAGAALTAAILLCLLGFILWHGVPNLTLPGLFAWTFDSTNMSMMPALINTFLMTAMTLLLAVPAGVLAAVYLVEYARRDSIPVRIVRLTAETLSGIPSIVYGLFGFVLFVLTLHWGYTFLSGAITLAIMVLSLVMRTAEEALLAVPDLYREGSYGLGAGKLRTVFRIVLPSAMPGILAGIVLSVGRIAGESAALIFTAGTNPVVPDSLFDSASTLSVHLYALLTEGLYPEQAYAVAVVLLFLVILTDALPAAVAKRLTR